MAPILGVGAAVLVLGTIAFLFNRLIGARNRARFAWADCDAVLQRRAAAVPRLADAVRGAMAHERAVLEAVARTHAGLPATGQPSTARFDAERAFGAAASRLAVVVEGYPQLRAQEAVAELVAALQDIEGDLMRARMVYNRTVQTYEDARGTFPSSLVAGAFRFGPLPYFAE